MKRIIAIILATVSLSAAGGIVTNWLTDPSGVPVSGITVRFGLLSSVYGRTNQFIIRKPIIVPVTSGVLVTNLVSGLYQVDFGSDYGNINILVPEGAGPFDLMTIATNLSTWNVTNYLNVFSLESLITDYGTAAYSNVTAFLLSYQTNQPLSQITNAGTLSYSNVSAVVLNSLSGVAGALGYTPATNTSAGVISALLYTPATNLSGGIISALLYAPATNSNAGIRAALGYMPATNNYAVSADYGIITNLNRVWLTTNLADAALPNADLPNGSLLTTSNGGFFVRSNSLWVQK